MRDYLRLMAPVLTAIKERHDDPKNARKGDYPTHIDELAVLMEGEFDELHAEHVMLYRSHDREGRIRQYERMREENADLMLYAAMMNRAIELRLQELTNGKN